MSWSSDKGYSAAGARPPQLDYFKMYFFFKFFLHDCHVLHISYNRNTYKQSNQNNASHGGVKFN